MLIEIKPVAIYGCIFKTKEEAEYFIKNNSQQHSWIDGVIRFSNRQLPGLERFSPDTWIVGFEMNLGETFEHYATLWHETFSDFYEEQEQSLIVTGGMYIRIPNGFNE